MSIAADKRIGRRAFDRAAADRMLVQGYHFPFPASGAIVRDGKNFAFVPRPG